MHANTNLSFEKSVFKYYEIAYSSTLRKSGALRNGAVHRSKDGLQTEAKSEKSGKQVPHCTVKNVFLRFSPQSKHFNLAIFDEKKN